MTQILLIEDSPLVRLGLRQLIKTTHPELDVVETGRFVEARAILKSQAPIALIFMDVGVRDGGGFVGLFQLHSEFPHIPVIVISDSLDPDSVSRAVTFGAAGYISKSASCEVIEHTLKSSLAKDWTQIPIVAHAKQVDPIAALSPAQLRVLRALKRGLDNKQIAAELGLSEKTIKAYMSTLYRKLGISNRNQAALLVQGVSPEALVPATASARGGAPSSCS